MRLCGTDPFTGFTNLYNFSDGTDGANPHAGLLLSGNTLYGTAQLGGSAGYGTVFGLNTNGAGFTTLHGFIGGADGANPYASVILSGNTLYGTAAEGGSSNAGTVFSLGLGSDQIVTPAASATVVQASSNPAASGQGGVIMTATVTDISSGSSGTPTGTVRFETNGVNFGVAVSLAGGSATSPALPANLPAGGYALTAVYGGDGNFTPSSGTNTFIIASPPPVACLMIVTRVAGATNKIALSDLATNWSDPCGFGVSLTAINFTSTNGQPVRSLNLTTNLGGAYVITNTAFLVYTNAANVCDQISYRISDGQGDSAAGYIELVVSTSPLFGQVRSVATPNGQASLNFVGQPGYTYTIQRSTNLWQWVNIWTTNAPATGVFSFTDAFGALGGLAPASAEYRLTWSP